MDIKFKQNHVNINMKATGGVGTKDHSKLTNLDYEHSGHTGFASAAQIQELLDLLNNKQDTLIAGDNITIVDNIISATGLTKDEIYIGPDEPADPNIKIWIDTNEVAQEFYTKEEIDAKNFATEGWVSAQGYLTQHQDLSEYAKKSEIPTKVSAFENDAGYLTEHQDLSEYALKTEIPTVPTNVSAFNNDAGYLTEHQSLADYALKTELPTEYVKSATVQGNKLTLTNKDNTTVEFEPSGGSGGGGKEYTFTGGLTETNGTVSWDLNDRIKASSGNGSLTLRGEVSSNFNPTAIHSMFHCYSGNISGSGHVILNGENVSIEGQNHIASGQSLPLKIQGGSYNVFFGSGTMSYNNVQFGFGSQLNIKGSCGACFGEKTTQNGCYQIVSGLNNIPDSGEGWNKGSYAVIVGNGTWSSQANAYTLDWQGNGTFAGTVSSSTGADYAEYFEWKDGNPNNEDRVGYIVTLDGDKIVKANTGDDILGICSGTAMVLGDSAEWNWNKRYLTDDFGRIIYEDRMEHHEAIYNDDGELIKEAWDEEVHAPKQNPEYDASQPYVKRADRPEWQIVGMMGKIYVRDDGSCIVNGYADVKDGIATKANGKTNMRVMERVSDNIVRVLMK